jgi:hypothetical protein
MMYEKTFVHCGLNIISAWVWDTKEIVGVNLDEYRPHKYLSMGLDGKALLCKVTCFESGYFGGECDCNCHNPFESKRISQGEFLEAWIEAGGTLSDLKENGFNVDDRGGR